tara:strand:+ start:353 stop:1408 length:1056 start_codon:yes stop_codon:yes gene_type:complete
LTYQHRSPSEYQHRSPFTYQHRSPSIYQVSANAQEPNIRNGQQPAIYTVSANAQEPNIRNGQQPAIYTVSANAQEPNIRSAQEPNIRDGQSPSNGQQPTIKNAQQPNIRDSRQPNNARQPNSARQPFTYRNPVNGQQPASGRQPFTYRSPVNGQQSYSFRTPFTYQHRTPIQVPGGGGGGGGCFAPGTMIWLADGSHAPIEHCVLEQLVMTWNENTKLLEPKQISHIMQPRICPIYDVELSDGRILQVTDSHPLMLANGEWGAFDVEKCVREHDWMEGVNSHEIKVGDNLFSMTDAIMFDREDEVGLEIISIDENQEMTVHNLSKIDGNHNFFANGMLVHNFQNIQPGFKP